MLRPGDAPRSANAARRGAARGVQSRPAMSSIFANLGLGILGIAAVAGMGACAGPFEMFAVAEAQAPADLGCPKDQVSQYRHAQYTFQGCGKYVVYRCLYSDRAICIPRLVGALPP